MSTETMLGASTGRSIRGTALAVGRPCRSQAEEESRFPLGVDRRALLRAAVGLGGAAALGRVGAAASLRSPAVPGLQDPSVQRVIVVAMAGGVRTRETLGAPGNVPNLAAMAKEGVSYTRVRSSNLGHFGATLSMFTGISEARGIRENARGTDPTLFEYLRKDLGLPASQVWITTSGGAQQTNYSHGLHPDYGSSYGASTLDGDGIFNAEFKSLLASYGRPRELSESEGRGLDSLRAALRGSAARGRDESATAEAAARVERYLLEELARGTADIRGANAADAKALRVARNLIAIFRPRLTAVVLQQADVAHGSFNAYVEVIRQNDTALGELWQAVKQDPDLAQTTTILVCPEFGRDADLNARRGLDHGDGSVDLEYVACVAWGARLRRGLVVTDDVRAIDVCPTVCSLLGASARLARGKVLPKLLA
jgi:arylsulfatase A-like enzyme